jgi:iron(III) transport system substrate-binding protein
MRTIRPADFVYIVLLVLLLAVPFALRPAKPALADIRSRTAARKSSGEASCETLRSQSEAKEGGKRLALVIVSPHNEAVQYEFEQAFRRWHIKNYGQDVEFDWRNIGGASEITRYLDGSFQAAERAGLSGIGIDLFFGGGGYEHVQQARKNQTVPCGLRERHPEWLKPDIIPRVFSGETFYDSGDRWYGCCLSSFGICYNQDALELCKILAPPRRWRDLADYSFFKHIALADPTKSASISKAFEMLIQQEIGGLLAERGKTAANAQADDLAEGWRRGVNLIRIIGANARYFTDSAGKVTVDVAQGDAAAGMCIDFYGRFESETVERNESSQRMKYVMPEGGTAISVDPIGMLRGAPNRAVAERFIDFVLSVEGQLLWNTRAGQPGGPVRYSLRRLPVRKDMYRAEYLLAMADPFALPYVNAGRFAYQAAWTGPLFNVIRSLIRAMCIDPHAELRIAWQAINRAGGPEKCPRAYKTLLALPPGAEYAQIQATTAGAIVNRLEEARLMREWTVFFRDQYRKAAELAQEEGR